MNWGEFNQATHAEKADLIVANPSYFKVCCGCDNVLGINTRVCPACHAYRASTSVQTIRDAATRLKHAKPYPLASRYENE